MTKERTGAGKTMFTFLEVKGNPPEGGCEGTFVNVRVAPRERLPSQGKGLYTVLKNKISAFS